MRRAILLLALAGGFITFSGCGGWLTHESVSTTAAPTITVQDVRPTGMPRVTIQTTPMGWQVTARQPFERTEIEERAVSERVQRMLFFPPAIFPGIIQCPTGGLTWLFSFGKYGRDLATHGCWRLLMIETLPGSATMTSAVVKTTRTVSDSEPLRGAIVQLDQAHDGQNWTHLLSVDGTVLIPYSAVTGQRTVNPTLTIAIYRQHDIIWRGSLPDMPKTARARPAHITWPQKLVFQIEESHEGDTTLLQPLQQLLQQELLRQGQCVVVGDSMRTLLRNELFIQEAGLTAEAGPTSSLSWIPATVLARMDLDQPAETNGVHISWIDVERGHVLGTELLTTSITVGEQRAQIRMVMQERLPRRSGCQKVMKTEPQ